MKRILLFLSMLLLVGGTTMAFLNGAYPNYLAHLANNESHSATNQVRGVDQPNGNNAGSSALDVVTLKKDNGNTQSLEQEGTKPTITFTTNKNVGEEITLYFKTAEGTAVEDITIEGATFVKDGENTYQGLTVKTYALTAQTVKILGDLTTLSCNKNGITSIDLSHSKLVNLYCGQNSITELNTNGNNNLSTLTCGNNQLTALDVSTNSELTYLNCNYNKISTLNLPQNNKLSLLACAYNNLKELNVSNFKELMDLSCSRNELEKLTIKNNPKLYRVRFFNTKISQFDFSNNPQVTTLETYSNNLSLAQMQQLVNNLPTIDTSAGKKGKLVVVPTLNGSKNFSNQLKDLAVSKGWEVKNSYRQVVNEIPEVTYITLTTDKNIGEEILLIHDVDPISIHADIEVEGATLVKSEEDKSLNYLGHTLVSNTYRLTSQTVKISGDLSLLYCPYNDITSIDVANTDLEYLICDHNLIKKISLKSNTPTTLSTNNPPIKTLEATQQSKLKHLICNYNQLTELDIPQNNSLEYLNCSNNKLKELSISNAKELKWLYCDNNELTSLTAKDNDILEIIVCYNNQISQINIANNPNLSVLECYSNQISLAQMLQLVNYLPTLSNPSEDDGILAVVSSSSDGNDISEEIQNIARSKGWKVEGANRFPLSVSTIEYDENHPRKVFDLNGREVNENQAKGVVIIKQGKKTYKKVVK
ncbi:MAG: leucine-rich repeat domain-containing protein [Prevotella sp.]